MMAYQGRMLPEVDYQKIETSFFSLADFENRIMQDCCDFLEYLKNALIEEHLMQVPELLVAHLCAYLGTAVTVHTVHEAKKLEPFILNLIQAQANTAYQHFNRYPINSTIKDSEQKKRNVEILRASAPGSIIVQTMRLGRVMMDILTELAEHRQNHFKSISPLKQTDLFCPEDTLIKIMLLISSQKCAEWREQLKGLSDHYVINQLAIQIGWLIGYFSHLDNESPDKTQYFEYGLPLIPLYQEHVFQLMESYADAVQAQEAAQQSQENREAEALLAEIQGLSEKAHAQVTPAFTDFQKQISITQMGIEKILMELLSQDYSIKIMLMSLFYSWFTLEAPLHAADPELIDNENAFLHMGAIIELIKNMVKSLPNPKLTSEITALNEKIQQLKSYLPDPEVLDKDVPENLEAQTIHANRAIHAVTREFIKQNIHLEAITISLFSHWMRFSVFFGVSESDWQKMDYYFPDIIKAARKYLCTVR